MSGKDKEPHAFSRLAQELMSEVRGVPFDEPRRQIKRPTKSLISLVEEILQKHQIGRDAPEHTLRAEWAKLVGPANANYSHPVAIERNRLLVLVSHSVVRNELFHHRDAILEKIRLVPGCADVKSLNLRSG